MSRDFFRATQHLGENDYLSSLLNDQVRPRGCHWVRAMSCDRIYVLDQGMIVEHGNHQELLRQGGIYAAMASSNYARIFPFSRSRLGWRSPAEGNLLKILRAKVEGRRTLAQTGVNQQR
jgi:hypothetical protein